MQRKKNKKSIILDKVNPSDFSNVPIISSCEQCSFFDPAPKECLMKYPSFPHQKKQQLKDYERTGKMAICRFLEID